MFKFLVKTAVTVGIVGLALEGVKKVLENRDEKQNANHDEHCEEEYITITPSLPVETETNTPEEPVENVEPVDNAKPVQKEGLVEQAEVTEEAELNSTEEPNENQSEAE